MDAKRKTAESKILKIMSKIDTSGENTKYYKKVFKTMTDTSFKSYMTALKNKEASLFVMLPNDGNNVTMSDIIGVCEDVGLDIKEHVVRIDRATKRKYKSPNKYMMFNLPVRRVKQYLFNKISLPDSDSKIAAASGQVMNDDASARITGIETKLLVNKGLKMSTTELLKMRGGDVEAYQQMKLQAEATGEVNMSDIDMTTRPRSTVVAGLYLNALHLEHNL